jgi:hypothetical protein
MGGETDLRPPRPSAAPEDSRPRHAPRIRGNAHSRAAGRNAMRGCCDTARQVKIFFRWAAQLDPARRPWPPSPEAPVPPMTVAVCSSWPLPRAEQPHSPRSRRSFRRAVASGCAARIALSRAAARMAPRTRIGGQVVTGGGSRGRTPTNRIGAGLDWKLGEGSSRAPGRLGWSSAPSEPSPPGAESRRGGQATEVRDGTANEGGAAPMAGGAERECPD